MDDLKAALKAFGVELPEFGNIQIIFRDGVPFDIIKEERTRIGKN